MRTHEYIRNTSHYKSFSLCFNAWFVNSELIFSLVTFLCVIYFTIYLFIFFVVLTFSYNLQNYNYTLLFASFCVFMICFVFSIKFSFICARIFNIVKLIIFVCVKFQHVLNLHISAKYKKKRVINDFIVYLK